VNIPVNGMVGRVFNLKKRGRQHRQQIRLADADQEVAKQDLTPPPPRVQRILSLMEKAIA
jgi:HAMP domain-containing protein